MSDKAMEEDVAFECLPLKQQHDQCFYKWLSEFLDNKSPPDYCQPIFTQYQSCLKAKLTKLECEYLFETPSGKPLIDE